MKRFFVASMAAVLAICCLSGCVANVETEKTKEESMFVMVEETLVWSVVYHRESKVMYAVSGGSYNGGTFTLLVNADGSPMLWEE